MHFGHHLIDHDHAWYRREARRGSTPSPSTPAAATDAPAGPRLWTRLYVMLAISRCVSNFGNSLSNVGLGYLVITETGSPLWVAVVATGYAVTFAIGGVINSMVGGRVDPRTMLWIGQGIEISADIFIIALILTDLVSGPTLLIASVLAGLLGAFEFPAWQILLKSVVPDHELAKGEVGHLAKAGVAPHRHLVEMRGASGLAVGETVTVEAFEPGEPVKVSGVSVGKGFQGTIKRHGFTRGPVSHGSHNVRAPGSIGASAYPSRVFKGMRMAGRMGGKRVTQPGLVIHEIDAERNLLLVRGSVPGPKSGLVEIRGVEG